MTDSHFGDQLALPGLPKARVSKPRRQDGVAIASTNPVVSVLPDLTALHLDRPFDYLVPEELDTQIQPGVRVSVRFGGRTVDATVLSRSEESDFEGNLQPIRRLISDVVIAPPSTLALCRAVADYYATNMAEVLGAAIPPRHARTEKAVLAHATGADAEPKQAPPDTSHALWADYHGGTAFLTRLAAGQLLRAVWTVLPNAEHPTAPWVRGIVSAIRTVTDLGRGALVVLPDDRDVNRLLAGLHHAGLSEWSLDDPTGDVVRLQASQGPAARYGAYLVATLGQARIVIGTRASAYAPVADLGLMVCWDDADDSHIAERHPRTSTVEILRLRSELESVSLLVAGIDRSLRVQQLIESGWARGVEADRALTRRFAPRVRVITEADREQAGGEGHTRLPPQVWRVLREGLDRGPVLVQVPRAGYIPALACAGCRQQAHCRNCGGPLQLTQGTVRHQQIAAGSAQCGWCGTLGGNWRCPDCGQTHLRSIRIGSARTAEELGRAFPRTPVKLSGLGTASGVIDEVSERRCLVVATPGAEPYARGGYTAAAILDADVMTSLPMMNAEADALHRWFMAAHLVRPAHAGGNVAIVGQGATAALQSLVRWDPAGFASRELLERDEAGLPPAYRIASITGDSLAVAELLRTVDFDDDVLVLGPAPLPSRDKNPRPGTQAERIPQEQTMQPQVRALIKVPAVKSGYLAATLKSALGSASAARRLDHIRVELDPTRL